MEERKLRFASRAVHAGRSRDTDQHTPAVDLSTTSRIPDLDGAIQSIDALNKGERSTGNPIYSRLHNGTVASFENALAELEGADTAVAFSSGMAAVTALLLDASQRGRNVVACRPLYGGTDHLLRSGLMQTETRFAEPGYIAQAIDSDTALILIETPANPTLELVDIASVVAEAGNVPVAVDSTFATPMLQQPLALGAAYSFHSATKFIGGHSDVLAGVVSCSEERAQSLRRVRIATGANLHPLGAYMLHRGLQTLHLRVHTAQENACIIATRLKNHPCIGAVFHPSISGRDPQGLIGRQMEGPGSLIAFECTGGFSSASALMGRLRLITPAVSLGSVDTLIQHPAGLTHRNVDSEALSAAGISEGMLRLSVGVEDAEDLWADLEEALG
jgi:methionine-gamma-lyase